MVTVGVQTWGTDVPALLRYWRTADALGYGRITYGDGLGSWTHDGWTMLGALAVTTRRARIGPAVTYAFDRAAHHPSWLAKRAVTVSELSGGRLDLRFGVGAEDAAAAAAWAAHDIPYPPAADRIAALGEAVAIVRALWRGVPIDFHGKHYALRGAQLLPCPGVLPKIWIAAMGSRALELTAACAEGWEASYVTPPAFGERWRRLRSCLVARGRDPERIERAVELDAIVTTPVELAQARQQFCTERRISNDHPLLDTALAGDPPAIARRIAEYADAGATDLMLAFGDFPATTMLDRFAAEVLPRLNAPARP